jgi:hypothetical protein
VGAVRFAFGDRPEVDELDALELVAALLDRANIAASRAAAKIEREAKKGPEEPRTDVQLNREALEQLVQALSEKRWKGDPHKVAHLRRQAMAHARGEWAPEPF